MTLRRKLEESFFRYFSALITLLIVLVLVHIIYSIINKGASALTWEVLSQEPKGGFYMGGGGGILNAIAGSFYLAIGATLLAFVVSLPVALFINIYLIKFPKILISIRFFLDVLWGIPSIVFGAFSFLLMMYMGLRNSLTNFVYNHIGHFGEAGNAVCKALFLGGVTRRFPRMRFAFLEGGVAWGCSVFANLISHWDKRNGDVIQKLKQQQADSDKLKQRIDGIQ